MRPDHRPAGRPKARLAAHLAGKAAGKPETARLLALLSDEARFLRTWLDRPLTTGAISPSGPALARAMAAPVDPALPGPIIELGPGTGPVTEALLARGVPEHRLILVEFDPDFCALLAQRFPAATVVEGDAYALERTLGGWLPERAAACVSSLPLLTRPEADREALLREAFRLMRPGAPFVQFTYGIASPVPHEDGGVAATMSPPVWLNLPPARVWVYRADPSVPRRPRGEFLDRLIGQADQVCDEWLDRLRDELRETTDRMRRQIRRGRKRLDERLHAHRAQRLMTARPKSGAGAAALLRRLGSRLGPPPA